MVSLKPCTGAKLATDTGATHSDQCWSLYMWFDHVFGACAVPHKDGINRGMLMRVMFRYMVNVW